MTSPLPRETIKSQAKTMTYDLSISTPSGVHRMPLGTTRGYTKVFLSQEYDKLIATCIIFKTPIEYTGA